MSLLDTKDDYELCKGVYGGLSHQTINVDTCGELERVVRLVWDSCGLIENGGFHYLFEGDYPGDPGFIYTAAAYARIGARSAYEAIQDAIRQFPGGILPDQLDERIRIYESLPEERWDEIERRYYAAIKEIESCLAQFIREHRSGYQVLLDQKAAEQAAPPKHKT
jgi:hypothetical protein